MRKIFFKTLKVKLLALTSLLVYVFLLAYAEAEQVRLTFVQSNDLHGNVRPGPAVWMDVEPKPLVGGLASMYTAILAERKAAKESGAYCVVVDLGDFFQGTPVGNISKGQLVAEFYKFMGYDLFTLGNHDYDEGEENVKALVAKLGAPVVMTNLERKGTQGAVVEYAKPWLVKQYGPLKVGFFGLMTSSFRRFAMPEHIKNIWYVNPDVAGQKAVKTLKEQGCGLIVCLAHLGLEESKLIAGRVQGIDLILDSHSHELVYPPVKVGDTLIAQASPKGRGIGVIDILYDTKAGKIVEARGRAIELLLEKYPENEELKKFIDEKCKPVDDMMNVVVGRTNVYLLAYPPRFDGLSPAAKVEEIHRKFPKEARVYYNSQNPEVKDIWVLETNFGNAIAEAMREAVGAQVAFQNPGGNRSSIDIGDITMEEVYRSMPFDNKISTCKLTVRQCMDVMNGVDDRTGKFMCIGGARAVFTLEGGKKLVCTGFEVGGKKLEPDTLVTVCTNDFLAHGGNGYQNFMQGQDLKDTDITIRDAFVAYIKKHSPLEVKVDGRIQVKESPGEIK